MKRILFILFFPATFFSQNIFAQTHAQQKVMVYQIYSFRHKGGIHFPITTFPFLINDSTSDEKLIAAEDSVKRSTLSPVIFALSDKDSSRYLAEVTNGTRHVVTRYDAAGNYLRITQYNKKFQRCASYQEYYTGMRMKVLGHYHNGNKSRSWKYYDANGKLTKKEKYKNGVMVKEKELKHPHRTFITLFEPKNVVPMQYKIMDESDTAKVIFAPDTVPMHHAFWGLSTSLDYFQNDFGNLRKQPWMLNSPPDHSILIGEELCIGSREKFFVSGGFYSGYNSTKTGPYLNNNAIHVSGFYTRYSALANLCVYKTKHEGFFIFGGATWSTAFEYSQFSSIGANGQSLQNYFQDSKINSGTMISTGIVFDFSNRPNHPNSATYFSFRAGYNFNTTQPTWYSSKLKTYDNPKISMGGIYFSLAVTLWRARK